MGEKDREKEDGPTGKKRSYSDFCREESSVIGFVGQLLRDDLDRLIRSYDESIREARSRYQATGVEQSFYEFSHEESRQFFVDFFTISSHWRNARLTTSISMKDYCL